MVCSLHVKHVFANERFFIQCSLDGLDVSPSILCFEVHEHVSPSLQPFHSAKNSFLPPPVAVLRSVNLKTTKAASKHGPELRYRVSKPSQKRGNGALHNFPGQQRIDSIEATLIKSSEHGYNINAGLVVSTGNDGRAPASEILHQVDQLLQSTQALLKTLALRPVRPFSGLWALADWPGVVILHGQLCVARGGKPVGAVAGKPFFTNGYWHNRVHGTVLLPRTVVVAGTIATFRLLIFSSAACVWASCQRLASGLYIARIMNMDGESFFVSEVHKV